jgi:SpoVK/Ycf46/Vps4 family AAA+-type ATPase
MIEAYPDDNTVEYNINMSSLHKIKEPLTDLNNMIGMTNLKENIVDQILFYIQNLHKPSVTHKKNLVSNDFMHTVIYGPPGTGKTEVAKIMGSIFSKLGILSKGSFKKVTRSDLVAGYLGQTALKTRDVIKDCLGGVLFIDEAYALGSNEKKDSFSKECIDTLCEALSDHKDNLMVIIAGYETDLNECFFNYNQGLTSRFTWRFKIEDYSAADLYHIFIKKVNENGWSISDTANINIKWFEKNKASFKYYGRDIETLFAKTKIAHSRRVFCLDESEKKKITDKDVEKGLELYLKNVSKKDDENIKRIISYMYS